MAGDGEEPVWGKGERLKSSFSFCSWNKGVWIQSTTEPEEKISFSQNYSHGTKKIQQKESEILSGLFHLLCADLGSGWGGSWPLFDLYPGLGVQVWETGREAPGHRLEVWRVWFNLGLLLYWAGGRGRTCRRWSHYHHWSDLSIKTFIWGSFQISTKEWRTLASELFSHLSGYKLRTIDKLREISVGLVWHGQAWKRPLQWVLFTTDLQVNHFNFFTVLQSLAGEKIKKNIISLHKGCISIF